MKKPFNILCNQFLISINRKRDSYNSILVIVNWLTKIVYYKLVKITLNVPGLAKVRINVLVYYYSLWNSVMTDKGSRFISKFWLLLYDFFDIKQRLSTTFHP